MNIRVGFGYDVHKLVEGRELWLGGIRIEHTMGLLGHSDADVLIHAICDALLGAANMRDIGYHFPDTAGEYEGIDSKILLGKTMALLRGAGYELGNIDATIAAERPNRRDHRRRAPEAESSHPGDETGPGGGDGRRRGRGLHQGDDDGEAGLHRPRGGHLGLCDGLDPKIGHAEGPFTPPVRFPAR